MATAVKKGGKINFAKVVAPAKEAKGDKEEANYSKRNAY